MEVKMEIILLKQSQLLRHGKNGGLENKLVVFLRGEKDEVRTLRVLRGDSVVWNGEVSVTDEGTEIWISEPKEETILTAILEDNKQNLIIKPVRHWNVHYLHWSHHDIGYTDLPDNVLNRHCTWLDQAVEELESSDDMPDDVRPRIVIEQFWSLHEYLNRADADKKERIYKHIKNGDIEVTAMYGNLITEQLSHGECYRAMYETRKLADELGITLDTAAHNDIPGLSYGICRALCDAGIKYFVPDFPHYYEWGEYKQTPFWDDSEIFDHAGPGGFWWEAPDKKRVLLWSSRCADGGTIDGKVDCIESKLEELAEGNYPYDCMRIAVKGGCTDNSPYIGGFAKSALEWNKKYAYPHIKISTNTRFFTELEKELKEKNITLPTYRGEMPGQDYPFAAMSMADVTTTARKTHATLRAAEMLLALAKDDPILNVPKEQIDNCWKNLILADDHAYGHHFPAGPSMRASYYEKSVYAMKAEAEAHDMLNKAMASITDRIAGESDEFRLVVFNLSGFSGNMAVETPLRMLDNCGTQLREGNNNPDMLTGYILNNRRHTVIPPEMLSGEFKLIDVQTQREVPFQIEETEWDDAEEYSSDRAGLGNGTRRYGFFEIPTGLKRIIRFTADDVEPYGYKTYKLIPADVQAEIVQCGRWISVDEAERKSAQLVIENEFYRITADYTGIVSIVDRRDGFEMLDVTCPHRLCRPIVLHPIHKEITEANVKEIRTTVGKVSSTLEIRMHHENLPQITLCVRLWNGVDTVDISQRVMKDARPLQTVMSPFPFRGDGISYQGTLNDMEPIRDFMPKTQSDFLGVQDWVMAKGSGILLNSMDTAVFTLGGLHRECTSSAHGCYTENRVYPLLTEEDYKCGLMYAVLSANNFGTNFKCSQIYDIVYRYHITREQNGDCHSRALWGEYMALGTKTMLTDRSRGNEKPFGKLLELDNVQCISLDRTAKDDGLLIRMWNHSEEAVLPKLKLFGDEVELIETDALGGAAESKEFTVLPQSVGSAVIKIKK